MYLDDLVSVQIDSTTRTPSREGFGTPCVVAYHALYADRSRRYTSLAGMRTDGFLTTSAAYKQAQTVFSQSPRVAGLKIGRRALPPTQVVVLTPPDSPVASTAHTVKIDGLTATFTSDGTPTLAEACTGVAAAINALADVDAIIATGGASTAGVQSLTATAFNGVVGAAAMSPARALSFTFSSHTDWDATTITVTGTDVDGNTITDTFAVPNGGSATVAGTKHFRTVTGVSIPAQTGTGGTYTMGTRAPVTAVASGTEVTCTAPVAGELHSYEVTTANLSIHDTTTDPGIATDLGAILAADPDFYGVLLDSNSSTEIMAAAAWTEANGKLFGAQSADTLCTTSGNTTNVMYLAKAAGYARTAITYYPSIGLTTAWFTAGWMGKLFPKSPGKATWAHKTIAAVSVYTLTDAQRAAIEAYGGNHYLAAGGIPITFPGKTASGEWIDVTRDIDWLRARLKERQLFLVANRDKIPFTDAGISLVVGEVRAQLDEAVDAGVLAGDPKPTVTAPRAADVSEEDRAARHLPGVEFGGRLAGAIHTLDITGRVSA